MAMCWKVKPFSLRVEPVERCVLRQAACGPHSTPYPAEAEESCNASRQSALLRSCSTQLRSPRSRSWVCSQQSWASPADPWGLQKQRTC